MVRLALILGLTLLALAGAAIPWDSAAAAPAAPVGLAKAWPLLLLPVCLTGALFLLFRLRGAGLWLMAALAWVSLYPFWVVFEEPGRLLAVMATETIDADRAYLWTAGHLSVGTLTDRATPPALGETPGALIASAPEWLKPGFWMALTMLISLTLVAATETRKRNNPLAVVGAAMATVIFVAAIGIGWKASRLTAQWDRTLKHLSAPEISTADAQAAGDFAEAYPLFMVNQTARGLLLRPEIPLPPNRRAELALLNYEWPYAKAEELLLQLAVLDEVPSVRAIALRRLWWSPLLRDWSISAWDEGSGDALIGLHHYLDDKPSATMWAFLSAWRNGRWGPAAESGEQILSNGDYAPYHASVAGVLGKLLTATGDRVRAREAWERSYDEEPSNNDDAVRGLGVMGP